MKIRMIRYGPVWFEVLCHNVRNIITEVCSVTSESLFFSKWNHKRATRSAFRACILMAHGMASGMAGSSLCIRGF